MPRMIDTGSPDSHDDRPIGAVIKQARNEAGKSQEALVTALRAASGDSGVDKKSISRWEQGKRIPTPYWRRHLSSILGLPLDALDRAAAATRAQRAVEEQHHWPDTFGGDAAERLGRAMHDAGRVDEVTVGHLEAITDVHRRLYHTLGSCELILIVQGHLGGVIRLLRGHQPATLRRRLSAVACETAGHVGWLSHDLDDQAAARRHYATAAVVAKEAGDPALGAYVQGFMSIVRGNRDRPIEALELARGARDQARRAATATTKAWLECLVAQGLAAVNHPKACLSSLADAERSLERSRPDQDPAWQYSFDRGRFHALAGACYRRLGMTVLAERMLQDALAALEPSCARRRSEVLLELAQVGLQGGDLDRACFYAGEALAGMIGVGSTAGVQQVYRFRVKLEPWRSATVVAELDERLSATL